MAEKFEKKDNPQAEFDLVREDVNRQLDQLFAEEFQHMKEMGDEVEEIEGTRERLQKREEKFFVRVLSAAQKAVETNPGNAITLFCLPTYPLLLLFFFLYN